MVVRAEGRREREQLRRAVGERRCRAQRHERVHVGREVRERAEAHLEVAAVREEHGYREQKLDEAEHHSVGVAGEHGWLGPAEHGAHRHVEQGHREEQAHGQLAPAGGEVGRGPGAQVVLAGGRGKGCALLARALRRGGALGARRARTCAVAGAVDGLDHGRDRLGAPVVDELHRVLEQVDVGLGHALDRAGGLAHARRAGGAGHALYVERLARRRVLHRVPPSGRAYMNFLKRDMTSSVTWVSPSWMRSTTQVSRWSCMTMRLIALTALSTAASCVRTSPQ